MGLAKAYAVSLMGLSGSLVEVEADISSALPSFVLVGLPDASLSEATSRVRSACHNSGFDLPPRKITVNLSPASVPKYGSSFDLSIAVAILVAAGLVPASVAHQSLFIGELGLDGSIRAVQGVLPAALNAKRAGFRKIICPVANCREAQLVEGLEVIAEPNLKQLLRVLRGEIAATTNLQSTQSPPKDLDGVDLQDVIGQPEAVEALIVAAAGGHHISLIGSPGSGKTMLAERLNTILPTLSIEAAIEVAAVHSLIGSSDAFLGGSVKQTAQFQAPHHSASMAAVIGGGLGLPKPGAISLAHRGVLFLDEVLEFQTHVIQSLREPLESRKITISRSAGHAVFPANFQLIIAANPCPCGNFGSTKKPCQCTALARNRYQSRLSGPIFDRIDIRLGINPVNPLYAQVQGQLEPTISSEQARKRVANARAAAADRLSGTRFETNAQVSSSYLRTKLKLPVRVTRELMKALEQQRISMRGFDRCLRLAWTLADVEGKSEPDASDLARALNLRGPDSPVAND